MPTRSKHTAFTVLNFYLGDGKGEAEREVQFQFTYLPGRPATPPSYSHGGLPPEPAEVEIDSVLLAGEDKLTELPEWMVSAFRDDEDVLDWLCREAQDDLAARADEWAEMKADEARGN